MEEHYKGFTLDIQELEHGITSVHVSNSSGALREFEDVEEAKDWIDAGAIMIKYNGNHIDLDNGKDIRFGCGDNIWGFIHYENGIYDANVYFNQKPYLKRTSYPHTKVYARKYDEIKRAIQYCIENAIYSATKYSKEVMPTIWDDENELKNLFE